MLIPLPQQFRTAGRWLLQRKQLQEASPNGQTISSETVSGQTTSKNFEKSYTQVATLVRPHVVRPKSRGELKLNRLRPHRLMGRYSDEERDEVIEKAERAELSMNEYIRAVTLGPAYEPPIVGEVRKQLFVAIRQLVGIATNINQMAHRMNAATAETREALAFLKRIEGPTLETLSIIRHRVGRGIEEPMP